MQYLVSSVYSVLLTTAMQGGLGPGAGEQTGAGRHEGPGQHQQPHDQPAQEHGRRGVQVRPCITYHSGAQYLVARVRCTVWNRALGQHQNMETRTRLSVNCE